MDTETVRDLLVARADDAGTALRFEDRCWSWQEYVAACARWARWLRARLDDRRPPHVGVLLDNVPEYAFLLGAAALSGIALVGLNPTRSRSELRRDLGHTDGQLVITDLQRFERVLGDGFVGEGSDGPELGDAGDGSIGPELVDVGDPSLVRELEAAGAELPEIDVDPATPLLLIFTSGTTSAPKAVICSQRKIAWTARSAGARRYRSEDVAYSSMPLFHSGAIMAMWAPMLGVGGTVVLRRRFSASAYLDDVRRYGCSIAHYVGTPLAFVLAQPERDDDADNPLRAVFGNEGSAGDIAEFARRFDCEVHDGYGSTELGISIRRVEGTPPHALGVPGDGDVRVVDPDTGVERERARFGADGRLVNEEQAVGELVRLDGPGLFEGYYNNADADAERLRDGVFHSGDLAYRDEAGFFYFAGRTGEWLRVDGENLAIAPIERALAALAGAMSVAVYAVPDLNVGDAVMAAVVPDPGARIDASDLQQWWRDCEELSLKARPRFVRIIVALEQTATFKTRKQRLRAEQWEVEDPVFWAPAPDRDYRRLTAADRRGLRAAAERSGRAHLLLDG